MKWGGGEGGSKPYEGSGKFYRDTINILQIPVPPSSPPQKKGDK